MKNDKKVRKISIVIALVLMVILVGAFIAFRIYISNYYAADATMIEEISSDIRDKCAEIGTENGRVFLPLEQAPRAVIVFYSGGKVESEAYRALMYELSSKGYICILPDMPQNIPLLGIDAVEGFKAQSDETQIKADNLDWYMAGHSLGGIAASKYLHDNLEKGEKTEDGQIINKYKGLILCASYPAVDISDKDIRMLSIYGSKDGVLKMDKYEESKDKWPEESQEKIIEGGNHSYFGCYGIQDGDGEPAISNEQQIKMAADIIEQWIEE